MTSIINLVILVTDAYVYVRILYVTPCMYVVITLKIKLTATHLWG